MTRTEFDREFSVRMDNTEGFNAEQLSMLNSLVFNMVESLDLDLDDRDRDVKSVVDAVKADMFFDDAIAKLA